MATQNRRSNISHESESTLLNNYPSRSAARASLCLASAGRSRSSGRPRTLECIGPDEMPFTARPLPYSHSMPLLYHRPGAAGVSPFDAAILSVARDKSVRVVCPYIGLPYLQRVLEHSPSWRLVTDVNDWVASLGAREVAPVLEFLSANCDKVRHLAGVHAKAVIGPDAAYFGSANLTDKGILARTELGEHVTDAPRVQELLAWFDGLWESSEVLQPQELAALMQWAAQGKAVGRDFSASLAPRVGVQQLKVVAVRAGTPQPLPPVQRIGQSNFEDLDDAVRSYLDKFSLLGFTLEQFCLRMERVGWNVPLERAMELLAPFCATHPESVFAPDTVNRLVLQGDRLRQSTPETFDKHVEPFDQALLQLVEVLDFVEFRPLAPFSAEIGQAQVDGYAAQLVRSTLFEQDASGFRLNLKASWLPRMQLFKRAYLRWQQKKLHHEREIAAKPFTAVRPTHDGFPVVPVGPSLLPYDPQAVRAALGEPPPARAKKLLERPTLPQLTSERAKVDELYALAVREIVKYRYRLPVRTVNEFAKELGDSTSLSQKAVSAALDKVSQGKTGLFKFDAYADGHLRALIRPQACDRPQLPLTAQALEEMSQVSPALQDRMQQMEQGSRWTGCKQDLQLRILRWELVDQAFEELVRYAWHNGNPLPFTSLQEYADQAKPQVPGAMQALEVLMGLDLEHIPVGLGPAAADDARLTVRVRNPGRKLEEKTLLPITRKLLSELVANRRPLFAPLGDWRKEQRLRWLKRTTLIEDQALISSIYSEIWSKALKAGGRLDFPSIAALEAHVSLAHLARLPHRLEGPLAVPAGYRLRFTVRPHEGKLHAELVSRVRKDR